MVRSINMANGVAYSNSVNFKGQKNQILPGITNAVSSITSNSSKKTSLKDRFKNFVAGTLLKACKLPELNTTLSDKGKYEYRKLRDRLFFEQLTGRFILPKELEDKITKVKIDKK